MKSSWFNFFVAGFCFGGALDAALDRQAEWVAIGFLLALLNLLVGYGVAREAGQ